VDGAVMFREEEVRMASLGASSPAARDPQQPWECVRYLGKTRPDAQHTIANHYQVFARELAMWKANAGLR
jgi:hypothetical protein